MYGTSKKAARTVVDAGKICILDIDMEGVKQIKASPELGSPMYAFIKPPSMEVLEARLRGRKTETEEEAGHLDWHSMECVTPKLRAFLECRLRSHSSRKTDKSGGGDHEN